MKFKHDENSTEQARKKGSTPNLKIFSQHLEASAQAQIDLLLAQPAFKDSKIRIMPDVHAGKGCVIGFTGDLGKKVIPNIVGVDIGCGMLCIDIGTDVIDFEKLDNFIHTSIPSGMRVNPQCLVEFNLQELYCYSHLKNREWIENSLGSLGGGNHFIEVDVDATSRKYLIIHTGSRNLGAQVATYYQALADQLCNHNMAEYEQKRTQLFAAYKEAGRECEIQMALQTLKMEFEKSPNSIPPDLAYLEGEQREACLHDMRICQDFAVLNRQTIAQRIMDYMGRKAHESFESIHNYISFTDNIVRKGAISAAEGQKVIIPINMRDGCIIGLGKGNDDWNQSAPHGAGRIMSRALAKQNVNLAEYQAAMKDVYTTSVSEATKDEAPNVYKPMQEILDQIGPTLEVLKIIKPIYNFKAADEEPAWRK